VNPLLIPLNLAEETELLEALDWDEESLTQVIDECKEALEGLATGAQAAESLKRLSEKLIASRGERVARIAITLLLKRSIQSNTEEIEA